eukprot:TRINITY_DN19879_c0_g1_i3.p2 TRINITY_DN19879_c0_g1~~TRINITY_DN19879_c0_g1_i3.p2  ORF type:complete len:398 (+),score=74.01 TRINITY_DN19879_c0_g1_i3:153-1346(+)
MAPRSLAALNAAGGKEIVTFGKHSGKTFAQILRCDAGYCDWAVAGKHGGWPKQPPRQLAKFVKFLKTVRPRSSKLKMVKAASGAKKSPRTSSVRSTTLSHRHTPLAKHLGRGCVKQARDVQRRKLGRPPKQGALLQEKEATGTKRKHAGSALESGKPLSKPADGGTVRGRGRPKKQCLSTKAEQPKRKPGRPVGYRPAKKGTAGPPVYEVLRRAEGFVEYSDLPVGKLPQACEVKKLFGLMNARERVRQNRAKGLAGPLAYDGVPEEYAGYLKKYMCPNVKRRLDRTTIGIHTYCAASERMKLCETPAEVGNFKKLLVLNFFVWRFIGGSSDFARELGFLCDWGDAEKERVRELIRRSFEEKRIQQTFSEAYTGPGKIRYQTRSHSLPTSLWLASSR